MQELLHHKIVSEKIVAWSNGRRPISLRPIYVRSEGGLLNGQHPGEHWAVEEILINLMTTGYHTAAIGAKVIENCPRLVSNRLSTNHNSCTNQVHLGPHRDSFGKSE